MNAMPGRTTAGIAARKRLLPVSVALLIAGAIAATRVAAADGTVYRCADGHSYSQQPCPAGQPVAVDDARTAAQRRDGEQVAQREAALAAQLQHEREAREAAPVSKAIGIGVPPKPAVAASAPRHHRKSASHRHRNTHLRAEVDDPTLSPPVRVPKPVAP
jgi:hypothetical protein